MGTSGLGAYENDEAADLVWGIQDRVVSELVSLVHRVRFGNMLWLGSFDAGKRSWRSSGFPAGHKASAQALVDEIERGVADPIRSGAARDSFSLSRSSMQRWLVVTAIAGCSRGRDALPPPDPAPRPQMAPPRVDAAPSVDAPPPFDDFLATLPTTMWSVDALTTDGKHAFMSEQNLRGESRVHFRVVEIATNRIETDLDLPALAASSPETGIADELRRIGPVIAQFPLGSIHGLAAAPDGRHVALGIGEDSMAIAFDGKIATRVAKRVAYQPRFSPDGKTLVFEGKDGTLDGVVGKYDLYITSVDGRRPPRVLPGTTQPSDEFAVTDAGSLRIVSSYEPKIPTCVVDVELAAPNRVTKLACLPEHEQVMSCVISPKGAWIACDTMTFLPELDPGGTIGPDGAIEHARRFRVRSMEVATGRIGYDKVRHGDVWGISDTGMLVVADYDGNHQTLALADAHGSERTIRPTECLGRLVHFLDATRFVTQAASDKLLIVDAAK